VKEENMKGKARELYPDRELYPGAGFSEFEMYPDY